MKSKDLGMRGWDAELHTVFEKHLVSPYVAPCLEELLW